MKSPYLQIPALTLLLAAAGLLPANAGVGTLTSPDNLWRFASDEFGAYGEALPGGGIAQRDFGGGLTSYAWSAGVLLSEGGSSRQWLAGSDIGVKGLATSLMGAGNLLSDSTVGNVRTSAFTVPGFANLRIDLVQTASNAGITQRYSFTNTRATALSLGVTSFHDVDLDGTTFLNDTISLVNGTLRVSEGTRNVYFAPSSTGYAGFLAGIAPGGGITGSLDIVAFDNFGIPGGALNGFWNVSNPAALVNFDTNNDKISDSPNDVGYLFQNNLTIPAGGTVSMTVGMQSVPEPSSALLALLGIGLAARRRR